MPGPSGGGIWAPVVIRFARTAALKASRLIRTRLGDTARSGNVALEPVLARNAPKHPIHPAAFLRQQKSGRWYSTSSYRNIDAAIRRFMSTGSIEAAAPKLDRTKFAATKTGRAVSQFTGRAPFASTLRPNLTGGALPRSAGGYGLGSGRVGGQRYFSHGPAAPAQVMQNVSSAVRAFWISGQKAQFDGMNARGEKRYRAVSSAQDKAARKVAAAYKLTAPGSYVDFPINPTVTALSPLAAAMPFAASATDAFEDATTTLNTEGFFDVLSGDFARAFQDLTATLSELRKLSSLGDLPIHLEKGGHILRVRFPGTDSDTVETLCEDLGLTRGVVHEDPDFDDRMGVDLALKFPFAPDVATAPHAPIAPVAVPIIDVETARSESLTRPSFLSGESDLSEGELLDYCEVEQNPWMRSPESEGYESMSPPISSGEHCSEDFEGMDGIYRFIEECDHARGRF